MFCPLSKNSYGGNILPLPPSSLALCRGEKLSFLFVGVFPILFCCQPMICPVWNSGIGCFLDYHGASPLCSVFPDYQANAFYELCFHYNNLD